MGVADDLGHAAIGGDCFDGSAVRCRHKRTPIDAVEFPSM